jgi:hypothetical protein
LADSVFRENLEQVHKAATLLAFGQSSLLLFHPSKDRNRDDPDDRRCCSEEFCGRKDGVPIHVSHATAWLQADRLPGNFSKDRSSIKRTQEKLGIEFAYFRGNGIPCNFRARDAGCRSFQRSIIAGRFRETAPMPKKPRAKRGLAACGLTSFSIESEAEPKRDGQQTHNR